MLAAKKQTRGCFGSWGIGNVGLEGAVGVACATRPGPDQTGAIKIPLENRRWVEMGNLEESSRG